MKILFDELKNAWRIYVLMFLPMGAIVGIPMLLAKLVTGGKMTWLQALTPLWVPLAGLAMTVLGFMGLSMCFNFVRLIRGRGRNV